ncbi:MAG: HAD hydrolase-like protein, partial [Planctomycetota bacterium]|nr:HAD hydrolase-like protein [Planctomycetota bacterium]
ADVEAVNLSVSRLLGGGEDYFAGTYYCPHLESDACGCRKPKPGLALRAARELGFSLGDAFVVGDREIDVELGRAAGAAGSVLVRTGYGAEVEAAGDCRPDFVAADLLAAARWIIARTEAGA